MRLLAPILLSCLALSCLAGDVSIRVKGPTGDVVSGVVVYLHGDDLPERLAAPRAITIHQQGKRFAPYLSVTQSGDEVVFTNRDDITHHIYSVAGPKRFSFKLRAGEERHVRPLSQAGVIPMGCNIHDWMSGYLLVVDTPYFGFTDSDGRVEFNDLAAGQYRALVWHPQLQEASDLALDFRVPETAALELHLSRPLAQLPVQKSVNDFDFLEEY